MKFHKDHTSTTDVYSVEDGPVEETAPGHLTRVRFMVEFMSVTYTDGELERVYVKGKQIKSDGQLGKSTHARSFFKEIPQWVTDFLNG